MVVDLGTGCYRRLHFLHHPLPTLEMALNPEREVRGYSILCLWDSSHFVLLEHDCRASADTHSCDGYDADDTNRHGQNYGYSGARHIGISPLDYDSVGDGFYSSIISILCHQKRMVNGLQMLCSRVHLFATLHRTLVCFGLPIAAAL